MDDLAAVLRGLPSLTGTPPPEEDLPDDPLVLLRRWLLQAIEAGVPEPHAAVLSTVGPDGTPDARVLILKALADDRLGFAGSAESAKGAGLSAAPAAALTFWWQALARSVRLRGRVEEGGPEEHRADFLERSTASRTAALVAGGGPISGRAELEADAAAAAERIAHDPGLVDPRWRRWWLVPDAVEFWQGDPSRLHHRVRYARAEHGWERRLLRP